MNDWRRRTRSMIGAGLAVLACLGLRMPAAGQAGDDADVRYVRGLVEMRLDEVLEDYLGQVERTDDVKATLLRIEAERARMDRPDTSAKDREAVVEAMLATRATLIESHQSDVRRAIWMADQAEDYYDDLFAIDAAGLTALYGYPSPHQAELAQRAARGIDEFASRAETEIASTILELEAEPGFDHDADRQDLRRRMIEQERDGRIVYVRGIGAYLRAVLGAPGGAERDRLLHLAATTLQPLADRLSGDIASRARLYAGLAQGRLGEYDASQALLGAVIDDESSLDVDVFAARMGLVNNRQLRTGTEAALAMLDEVEGSIAPGGELFYHVLIADRRFLLRRRLAKTDASFSLADAYRAYLDLLDLKVNVPAEQLKAIVYARLVNASDADTPLSELPVLVTVARAGHLARDEHRPADAAAMLKTALESGRVDDEARPGVVFELARTLYEAGAPLEAAQRFIEVARTYPTYEQAEEAAELAASIAERLHRERPEDIEAKAALQDALNVLLTGYPNLADVDRWRYAAGRLALSEERFDDAISLFRQISPDSERWPDGLFMQAAAARARARSAAGSGGDGPARQEAIDIVRNVRPLLGSALEGVSDKARRAAIRYYLGLLDVFEAEAQLGLGRPQDAIDTLAVLVQASDVDETVLAEALRVRISAFQAADRTEEAQGEIERFISTAPDQVERVIGPMLGSLEAEVSGLIDAGRPEEAEAQARRVLEPIAAAVERWIETSGSGGVELSMRVADAYRMCGRYEDALPLYERLLDDDPSGVQLLYGRAECLFRLGGETNFGTAMTIYRRLAAAGEGETAASRAYYWAAQLRMLQILDQMGRNTEKILPRIRQLRQRDKELGGLRFRRGFERLQNRYS